MLITFAATTASCGGAGNPTGELVLQIATQDAVFDQNVALRLVAFVVNIERAATAAYSAVVHHGTKRTCHLLADAVREGGDALAIEISLESMSYRFMQQYARPAGSKNDRLFARRRFRGA